MPATLTKDALDQRQKLDRTRTALLQERTSFDAHWRELGEQFLPRRTRFFVSDRNRGERRNQHIIDSTGIQAARALRSGLHAGLTSPARPWMRLSTPDPSLAEFGPVKAWLHLVTSRMLTVFSQSNLYNALPTLYGDMGVFGTGAMSALADAEDLFRCYSYPIGSYAIGIDARGVVSTFVQDVQITIEQLVEQFGGEDGQPLAPGAEIDWSRISDTVKAAWDDHNQHQAVGVTWVVQPQRQYDEARLDAKQWRFASCHFETAGEGVGLLRESGFRYFPIMVPRWEVTGGDFYGTDCPGMTALGDMRGLQIMQKRKAQGVEKLINPPVTAPMHLQSQKVSMIPGDVTYVDLRDGQQGVQSIHDLRLPLGELRLDLLDSQARIDEAFYKNLFLMLAESDRRRGSQPITAREVEERHEEKLLMLGPVLEQTNDELLDPLIDRVFDMLQEQSLIPPPPRELQGINLKVEYVSVMAQAQKLVGVVATDRFLQTVVNLAPTWPEVRHKVVIFQAVDNYGDQLGVDPNLVRSDEEAGQIVAGEQQAMRAAAEAEQLAATAQSTKALADTSLEGDTALRRLVEGAA